MLKTERCCTALEDIQAQSMFSDGQTFTSYNNLPFAVKRLQLIITSSFAVSTGT